MIKGLTVFTRVRVFGIVGVLASGSCTGPNDIDLSQLSKSQTDLVHPLMNQIVNAAARFAGVSIAPFSSKLDPRDKSGKSLLPQYLYYVLDSRWDSERLGKSIELFRLGLAVSTGDQSSLSLQRYQLHVSSEAIAIEPESFNVSTKGEWIREGERTLLAKSGDAGARLALAMLELTADGPPSGQQLSRGLAWLVLAAESDAKRFARMSDVLRELLTQEQREKSDAMVAEIRASWLKN